MEMRPLVGVVCLDVTQEDVFADEGTFQLLASEPANHTACPVSTDEVLSSDGGRSARDVG